MLIVSNALTLLRAPLAFLFLIENSFIRVAAILLAMFSDSIDGYLARKFRSESRFGAILDPIMDKFFVIFAISILLAESKIASWEALSMISRDFSLCLFGLYLAFTGHWHKFQFTAIRWGKVSTALQFLVLIALSLGYTLPSYLYTLFILLGTLAFIELCQLIKKERIAKNLP